MNAGIRVWIVAAGLMAAGVARGAELLDPAKPKTGSVKYNFPEHAPYSGIQTVLSRTLPSAAGNQVASALRKVNNGKLPEYYYDPKVEEWLVHVPKDYDRNVSYGLVVFLSAGGAAGPQADWQPLLAKRRLIWASPDKAGNSEDAYCLRIPKALDAVYNLGGAYTLDDQRIYVSGFSGGGRAASRTALGYPDVFAGGIFFCGVDYFRNVPVAGKAGSFWPASCAVGSKALGATAMGSGRYVLVTGTKDSNEGNTKDIFAAFRADGFKHVALVDTPDMGHTSAIDAEKFEGCLKFLDEPVAGSAETLHKQAQAAEKLKELGKAMRLYGQAAGRGADKPFVADAAAKAGELRTQYDSALAELTAAVAQDKAAAGKAVAEFKKFWAGSCERDVAKLMSAKPDPASRPDIGATPKAG